MPEMSSWLELEGDGRWGGLRRRWEQWMVSKASVQLEQGSGFSGTEEHWMVGLRLGPRTPRRRRWRRRHSGCTMATPLSSLTQRASDSETKETGFLFLFISFFSVQNPCYKPIYRQLVSLTVGTLLQLITRP